MDKVDSLLSAKSLLVNYLKSFSTIIIFFFMFNLFMFNIIQYLIISILLLSY